MYWGIAQDFQNFITLRQWEEVVSEAFAYVIKKKFFFLLFFFVMMQCNSFFTFNLFLHCKFLDF